MAKVLLINGSAHPQGCTARALKEVEKTLQEQGIETGWVNVGNKDVRGCISCFKCMEQGKCVFNDLVNETAPIFAESDGIVVGTPVYYAHANGGVLAFLIKSIALGKEQIGKPEQEIGTFTNFADGL